MHTKEICARIFRCIAVIVAALVIGLRLSAQAHGPLTDQEIEQRANHLLLQMSSDEKIGPLRQLFYFAQPISLPNGAPSAPVEDSAINCWI